MAADVLWWRAPAPNWIQALPIGDGRLGARVFGNVDNERLALNIETLWSGKPLAHGIADGPAVLSEIRSLLLSGERAQADQLDFRLQGPFNNAYQPLGDLLIAFADSAESPASDYRAELDLAAGTASCSFVRNGVTVRRQAMVSSARRAIVVVVEADAPVALRISLVTPHPTTSVAISDGGMELTGFAPATVDRKACHAAGQDLPTPGMTYTDDAGVGFASVLRVHGDTGCRKAGDELLVEGRRIVLWVTAATTFSDWRVAPSRDLEAALTTARAEAEAAIALGTDGLLEAQAADHGALFRRARLELDSEVDAADRSVEERVQLVKDGGQDPSLFATLYDFARYLLISSSRPGSALPANLQGLWNDNRNPPWFCSFTTNINVQMNYWLAEPGNLSECADPFLDYVESLAEAGTQTAREVFGFDGWCANHNADIWRASWPSGGGIHRPTWSLEPTCGMWVAGAFTERDNFRPDDAFIRDRALPLYEGAARFALDLLVRTERGLIVVPSTSPENNYKDASGQVVDFDLQTTFDLWMVRETFDTYLGFASRLGVENDTTRRVAAARAEIEEPRIGSDGRLQEWSDEFEEPEPGHRHLSHLYGLFPGNHIDPVTTPELAEAARLSLEGRIAGGAPVGGWTHCWMAALFARLFDAERASWVVHHFMQSGQIGSGLSYQSWRGIHQMDANFGIGNAVSEMLLQSHRGVIRPLPCLPREWTGGRFSGFKARGGVTVGVSWKDGRAKIEITADRDCHVRVAYPDRPDHEITITLSSGEGWTGAFELPAAGVGRLSTARARIN